MLQTENVAVYCRSHYICKSIPIAKTFQDADPVYQAPLSFVTSFLALDITQFPKDANGTTDFHIGTIMGIFGEFHQVSLYSMLLDR